MTPPPTNAFGLPQKGDIIAGKYQVEDSLGQGGVGVVVAAVHLALRQRVAVKFLLPAGMSVPGARERFLREAQAAAAIQSEHVMRVLDIGTLHTGAPYIVLEYLSGIDLSQLLKTRGRLPIAEAIDLVLQTCEAIGEAHALGIVHRDIKPQNLFVIRRAGAPFIKVLDFGLAKMAMEADLAGQARLTATSLVIGSPQYMSPEQFQSLKHVDARADLWALGVILYQLISGRRPFEGKTMAAVCENILATTPVPLQAHRRETPLELDALVQRCLEKDPNRRIQSVAELVQRLAPFAQSNSAFPAEPMARTLPIAATTTTTATATTREQTTVRIGPWRRLQRQLLSRKATLIASVGMVAAAVIGVLMVGSLLWSRDHRRDASIVRTAPEGVAPEAEIVEVQEATVNDQTSAPPDASASASATAPRTEASAPPLTKSALFKPPADGRAPAATSQPNAQPIQEPF
jgi:eukaryotic-like serine/threonine-protein kinase